MSFKAGGWDYKLIKGVAIIALILGLEGGFSEALDGSGILLKFQLLNGFVRR